MAAEHSHLADLYHAFHHVHSFTTDPFTDLQPEVLLQVCDLYLIPRTTVWMLLSSLACVSQRCHSPNKPLSDSIPGSAFNKVSRILHWWLTLCSRIALALRIK